MNTQTIVFIHGMYMTPLCWEHWLKRFQDKGYRCLAPAWPGRDRPVEELRKNHPDPQLGQLTLRDVLEGITRSIQSLDEKPVLIGHSMGGLVVQLLLQKGFAAAGVAIDSAPPFGVFTPEWSFLKSNWPHINPLIPQSQPIQMTFERFQYTFVNTLPEEEQRRAFERYVVPESRRVPGQSLTSLARINFKKQHPPLLLVAGEADHIIPPGLNKINYDRYRQSASLTDLKVFPKRTHFIIGQEDWEEVADYTISWISEKLR